MSSHDMRIRFEGQWSDTTVPADIMAEDEEVFVVNLTDLRVDTAPHGEKDFTKWFSKSPVG